MEQNVRVPLSPVPDRAGLRQWLGLAVLTLPAVLIAVDFTVLHLAVPHIAAALDASGTEMLWVVDIYGFMVAGLLIAMGSLGDRIGRRRILMIGAAAFAAASALAAASTSAEMLIAARALLGIAGATLLPSTVSLISNMFKDERQRRMAIAVWTMGFAFGGAAGPLAGGLLLEHFHWGVIFLLAIPVMVGLLIGAPLLVPEYRNPDGSGRIDLASVGLLIVASIGIVYAIKEIANGGDPVPPGVALAIGALAAVTFVRRQSRLENPLLDLGMFADRHFNVPLGTLTLSLFALGAITFLLMQHLQLVHDLTPLEAGLWSIPAMAAGAAGSLLTPGAARAAGPVRTASVGLLLGAAGLLAIAISGGDSSFLAAVAGFAVVNLGINAALVISYDSLVASAPEDRAGAAAGTAETGNELGIALGIALAGSLAAALYRGRLDGEALPAALSPAEAATAQDSLSGAVDVAGALPERAREALLEVAQPAFAEALQVTSLLLAALVAGLAATVWVLLRERAEPEGAEGAALHSEVAPEGGGQAGGR